MAIKVLYFVNTSGDKITLKKLVPYTIGNKQFRGTQFVAHKHLKTNIVLLHCIVPMYL